ncbi:MAG: MarR family transcriptional regulator [Coriobacteriales bacterium]|jgi:DNA-binding MarR family transcriptional regulator|nr:MarR family transcriptional regulator [Coriobacteriales bacterium]
MEYEILKLENQLCFPLYAASKEVVKRYGPYLDEIGLTYTQYITMMVLWEHRAVNVKTLGNFLHLDSGTLTPLLKKLEAKGYLTRKRSATDERKLEVRITESGEALKERAQTIPTRLASCLNLSSEEAVTLYRLLYKMLEA